MDHVAVLSAVVNVFTGEKHENSIGNCLEHKDVDLRTHVNTKKPQKHQSERWPQGGSETPDQS